MMEANSISNNDLHIYLYDPLMKGLSELEKFADKDPIRLNNAIMALYAHKLYHEVINNYVLIKYYVQSHPVFL